MPEEPQNLQDMSPPWSATSLYWSIATHSINTVYRRMEEWWLILIVDLNGCNHPGDIPLVLSVRMFPERGDRKGKIHPEYGWHYPTDWDPRLNRKGGKGECELSGGIIPLCFVIGNTGPEWPAESHSWHHVFLAMMDLEQTLMHLPPEALHLKW